MADEYTRLCNEIDENTCAHCGSLANVANEKPGIHFNINQYVFVKLTDKGRAEYRRQHGAMDRNGKLTLDNYNEPKEDNEGWSKWQMWELMNTFGHMLYNGANVAFEPTIRIDVKGSIAVADKPTPNKEIFWHSFKEMLASYCAEPLPHSSWQGVFNVGVERDGNQDVLSLQGVIISPEGEFNVFHDGNVLTGVASSVETTPLDTSKARKITDILFFDRSTGERVSGVKSMSMLKVDVFEMAKDQRDNDDVN